MAQARELVLPAGSLSTYHVITRCTRRVFLLGNERSYRRAWTASLLAELLRGFAIDLHAYAIMSNHVHLVLRPRPDLAASWDEQQVARVGLRLMPIWERGMVHSLTVTPDVLDRYADNMPFIADYRERLSSISWLMRLFKQRIAKRANAEDGCTGHFWEGRFQTVPLLDNGAVYACMAYVDRNPLRAGMARTLGESAYASVAQRLVQAGRIPGESFDAEDRELGRCLTALGACSPLDAWTGELRNSGLRLDDYLAGCDRRMMSWFIGISKTPPTGPQNRPCNVA